MKLSKGHVRAMLTGNKEWAKWLEPLNLMLPKYEINTVDRISMFMAQCMHESGNFRIVKENLNYSEEGLNSVFSKYFKKAGRNAADYARDPERIANIVYANRMGNGDTDSGDGFRFRGRGIIQLTGCNNYTAFAESVGMSVDEVVDYLETTEGSLESACWFWDTNKLNSYADANDIEGCTKRINGGYNGLADRNHHWLDCKHRILTADRTELPRPVLLKLGMNGDDVKEMQKLLGVDADGWFGAVTEKAVKEFQKKYDLVEDGVVGNSTFKKLQKLALEG